MPNIFKCEVLYQHKAYPARITKITTPHGVFLTPTFMPVGTKAAVNCLSAEQLLACNTQIILGGNTYHMLVNPGMEIIKAAHGMHVWMGWPKPMLTDSGGFQVFSLSKNAKICRINADGAHFKHPNTGKIIQLTPKISIATQKIIGADIMMAFDECTPENGSKVYAKEALARTHQWLLQCKEAHAHNPYSEYGLKQALFGIIQGGGFKDLREESADFILKMELDGIAIGGEVIGFNMVKTLEVIDWVRPFLPTHKPRYTMGVGLHPKDLLAVAKRGIDIFDCVAPTRNARHGALYHGFAIKENDWLSFDEGDTNGRILIKKSMYAKDDNPILVGCDCYTCQRHSRSYLHYLFKQSQALYAPLACMHNVRVMQKTCEMMQAVIQADSLAC